MDILNKNPGQLNIKLFSLLLLIIQISFVYGATETPSVTTSKKYSDGRYVPSNKGRYMPRDDAKYVHIHDMRELGRYIHIPFPYDGGYGPYSGKNIPYEYDPTGQYSIAKYQTVSTPFTFDPFKTNEYTIPIPEICLQYGFPQYPYYQPGAPLEQVSRRPLESSPPSKSQHESQNAIPKSQLTSSSASTNANSLLINGDDDDVKDHIVIIEKRESIPDPKPDDKDIIQNDAPMIEAQKSVDEKSENENPQEPKVEHIKSTETQQSDESKNSDSQNLDAKKLNNQNLTESQNLVTGEEPNLESKNSENHIINDNDNVNVDNDGDNNNNDDEQSKGNRERRSIFNYSQTKIPKPATTARPRTRYDDEGKWRIIRQNEKKQKKNYEYLYETENGIIAQEKAVIDKSSNGKEGTQSHGFYQYIGDDGKIYRVEYTVGEHGFIPKGDHLPKALQQSLEIQRRRHQNQL